MGVDKFGRSDNKNNARSKTTARLGSTGFDNDLKGRRLINVGFPQESWDAVNVEYLRRLLKDYQKITDTTTTTNNDKSTPLKIDDKSKQLHSASKANELPSDISKAPKQSQPASKPNEVSNDISKGPPPKKSKKP